MQDLKDATSDVLYENYRAQHLAKLSQQQEYAFTKCPYFDHIFNFVWFFSNKKWSKHNDWRTFAYKTRRGLSFQFVVWFETNLFVILSNYRSVECKNSCM